MALSDAELGEVERFAALSGLDEIARLCAELRAVRREYLQKCGEVAKLRNMVTLADPSAHSRYGKELDKLTGEGNAP